jgi:transcription termination/antitermination protein NusA
MITTIGQNIDALKEEYGLDRELVIEAMKDAVLAAARKQFKSEYKGGESLKVDWNDEEGMVEISAEKEVVEEVESSSTEISLAQAVELTGDDEIELGDVLSFPLPTEELGRIAAQTAKQILIQKVREAIREKVYEEYIDRKGELINGLVKRFERGDIVVDLGTNLEAILPKREQTRGENWAINDRIRVVIEDVSKDLRGQQVVVSRASAELLKRLFEMEVPEIYDNTVVIKSAVREPGDRAKIAVATNEKDVDPVGACVGMKGSRVQSIIKELRGEKIDIIEWSDEPSVFAANALSPAKVSQVRITDINERKMEVIVIDDQLSLAIGKRGQNVRLATRLVGWDIDIVSEEILKQEITEKMGEMMASGKAVPISALDGMTAGFVDALGEKGIEDIESLANITLDELTEILDISIDDARGILEAAQKVIKLKETKSPDAGTEPAETVEETEETEETVEESEETVEETGDVTAEESAADEPLEEAETEETPGAEPDASVEEETPETAVSFEEAEEVADSTETDDSAEESAPETETTDITAEVSEGEEAEENPEAAAAGTETESTEDSETVSEASAGDETEAAEADGTADHSEEE